MTDHEVEDPAADALGKAVRVSLMAAAAAAELAARYWRRERAGTARRAGEEARQAHAAYSGQRRLAELHVASLDEQWLATAGVEDLAHAWEVTRTWVELEPETFQAHEHRIKESVRERYGFDLVTATSSGSDLVRQLRDHSDADRVEPATEAEISDAWGAATVVATAGDDVMHDIAEEAANDQVIDPEPRISGHAAPRDVVDAERLDGLAARCASRGVDLTLTQARVTAARSQAYPTSHAVHSTSSQQPASRKARGPQQVRGR